MPTSLTADKSSYTAKRYTIQLSQKNKFRKQYQTVPELKNTSNKQYSDDYGLGKIFK